MIPFDTGNEMILTRYQNDTSSVPNLILERGDSDFIEGMECIVVVVVHRRWVLPAVTAVVAVIVIAAAVAP
uniref:Uncharacterized protein n=1 Tax=Oryza brachyantha TaxID=4533 RepID=J3LJQ2_ORYBR